jgi:predicted HTH domain antitoxin
METIIEAAVQDNKIILELPENIMQGCKEAGFDIQNDIKKCLAVRLYQKSLVSIGKAAELAGMDRVDFEYYLSNNRIPISNLSLEDIMADVEKLKNTRAAS